MVTIKVSLFTKELSTVGKVDMYKLQHASEITVNMLALGVLLTF